MNPNPGKQHDSRRSLFGSVAMIGVVLVLANALAGQSQQAPTLRIVSEDGNRLPSIVITGANIRSLPAGETQLIQKFEGGDIEAAQTQAGGGVWKTINGGKTWDLQKTGAGTLAFPTGGTAAKQGQGTLVLTGGNNVVYEFRDLSAAEFEQVFITVDGERLSLSGSGFMARHRPADAMKKWPFKRLLIAPVTGNGKSETAMGKVKTYTNPVGRYTCEAGKFCQCNGVKDCQSLADANQCASMINCDGERGSLNCYCKAK
ncbi:MAG TPA: hypothetical protein VFX97_17760 [Pyrinomonadaceae bacterium]|nr:hypothetical protein [Pyrinomonadaceae bacterium]